MIKKWLAILTLAFCSGHTYVYADTALPETELSISGHKLTVEIAATEETQTTGLMFRRMMPENRGMLFVFSTIAPLNFWMKNTYLPLSIAFIDQHGVILNIADMKPLTTDPHPSAGAALYALEMNQGWFAKRHIKAGSKIDGLTPAAAKP